MQGRGVRNVGSYDLFFFFLTISNEKGNICYSALSSWKEISLDSFIIVVRERKPTEHNKKNITARKKYLNKNY